jgi:hypothetical protein
LRPLKHRVSSLVSHGNKSGPFGLSRIGNPSLEVGQALHGNWWRPIQPFRRDTTYDAYNLFEQVIQRDRPPSVVPQKGYGVPAHRDDND